LSLSFYAFVCITSAIFVGSGSALVTYSIHFDVAAGEMYTVDLLIKADATVLSNLCFQWSF